MPLPISDIRAMNPAFESVGDVLLASVLSSVELTLEKILNRKLGFATETEWHPVESFPRIYLRRPPVSRVEYVDLVYFTDWGSQCGQKSYKRTNQSGKVWVDRDYVFTPESGTLNLLCHPKHLQRDPRAWYAVKYTGGFDPIPADLLLASAIMAQHRLSAITGPLPNSLAARERIGDYEIEYRSGAPVMYPAGSLASRLGPGGDLAAALAHPYIRSGVNGI
jgi:hypothetical protein